MGPVQLEDAAPRRVEVGLGHHQQDRGSGVAGVAHEVDLGPGQLLGGVGDHHDEGRATDRGQRGRRMPGRQATDAGGVDDDEATAQDPARHADLDGPHRPFLHRGLGHVRGQLDHLDGLRFELVAVGGVDGLPEDRRRRLVTEPAEGGDGGGDVVVDGADVHVEQGVHEGALALLELADDDGVSVGGGEKRTQTLDSGEQVVTAVGVARLLGEIDHRPDVGESVSDGRRGGR